jgi:peroxiredoxin
MKNYLFAAAIGLMSIATTAQENKDGKILTKSTTFLLPDGKKLNPKKLDSLESAWGKGRVLFSHSEEDDKKGIIRLIKKTDSQIKKDQAEAHAFASLVNKPAPQFELTDMQGKKWSLKQLRGKIVVLNFWFTSCPPCVAEMPELNKIVQQYKGKDVVFLALSYNNGEQINTFLKKHDFNYTILPNSEAVDISYKVNSWPTSIVIDKKGIIRFAQVSGQDINARLTSAINNAL